MKCNRSLGIVIKLGTSSIVDEKTHEPLLSTLTVIVETAVRLRKDGHKVVIVSSGAIGVGLRRMDVDKRPKHVSRLQALAAIGQCRLMSLWDGLFSHLRQPIAQILLTRSDIADRSRYLNAQNTFNELLDMGVIPIVNENDTLAVSEIKFGDNDTLSAITAGMVHADLLFLMTDVDCLYDKNPRTNPDAQPIEVVEDIGQLVADVSTAGSSLGTGGMSTKIVAARLATSAGVTTVITRSSNPGNILSITRHVQASRSPASLATRERHADDAADGDHDHDHDHDDDHEHQHPLSKSVSSLHLSSSSRLPVPLHTRFLPSPHPIRDRSFWILHGLKPHGTIYIDAGAHRALLGKAGLLPAGVVDVEGAFAQQEAVSLCVVSASHKQRPTTPGLHSPDDHHQQHGRTTTTTTTTTWADGATEVGRALVNYSSTEIARIKGRQSAEIEGLLGYADSEYVAQRETIVLFPAAAREGPAGTSTPSLAATAAGGSAHGHSRGMTPGAATPVREMLDGNKGIGGYEVGSGGGL